MHRKLLVLCVLLFSMMNSVISQEVFVHVENKAIYEFLDELANQKIIAVNSAIKPYSRKFIAQCLVEAQSRDSLLTVRQQKELAFYLKDYNKELLIGKYDDKRFDVFYYSDSNFKFSLNPILGGTFWKNASGNNYRRWVGAEAFGYMGKHLALYASLRDNHEKLLVVDTTYLTIRLGMKHKAQFDYSEMRGGITWSWKWGMVGLVKDHMEWGNNYHFPNIISAKAPSFAHIKLHLKPVHWFEFNYIHGWLISELVDSSSSYNYNGVQRNVFHNKYMAANMFTFYPVNGLGLSFGNSIVYSDGGVKPAYLIPIFFYKSVDHTYNGTTNAAGQNSQLFFDISIRLIPKTHLYYSWYLDDLSFSRMFDKETQSNHWSMKWGLRLSNLIPNVSFTAEYTRTNPLAYKNDVLSTTFTSNWYKLGHYLKDNAHNLYLATDIRPFRGFHVQAWLNWAQKGPDYPYIREPDPETGIPQVHGKKFLDSVEWEELLLALNLRYQVLNDVFIYAEAEQRFTKGLERIYTAPFYHDNPLSLSFGMTYGF